MPHNVAARVCCVAWIVLALACAWTVALAQGLAPAALPTLEDERATYRRWGYTWNPAIEPQYPTIGTFTVSSPNIHDDTEGDDLWTSLHQYARTGQQGYMDRALGWGKYFSERYTQCRGKHPNGEDTLCYDRGFLYDHIYGWGLLDLYAHTKDPQYLVAAERLGGLLEKFYLDNASYIPGYNVAYYNVRWGGRHLHLLTRLTEAVPSERWVKLRDKVITLWKRSPDQGRHGVYGLGYARDYPVLASNPDLILVSPLMLAILNNAFAEAYRTTQDPWFRTQMVRQAQFVALYGLDATYQYTGSRFGVFLKTGKSYHNYGAANPVTFWDPVYTGQVVNILVRGYQYTGEVHFLERAWLHFQRANGGIYGEPLKRSTPANIIHHFVDTKFSSVSGKFFYDYGKGELQYMWTLFQGQGSPPVVIGLPPQVAAVRAVAKDIP